MKNILMIMLCAAGLPLFVNAQETNNEIRYRKISMEDSYGKGRLVHSGYWSKGATCEILMRRMDEAGLLQRDPSVDEGNEK
jgi:hypothetical protein